MYWVHASLSVDLWVYYMYVCIYMNPASSIDAIYHTLYRNVEGSNEQIELQVFITTRNMWLLDI